MPKRSKRKTKRQRRRSPESTKQKLDTDPKVSETLEYIISDRKLLEAIKAYGYEKLSKAQHKALVPLKEGRDVIVRGESYPQKSSTICIGILQLLNCPTHSMHALVATANHDSAVRIGKDMLALGYCLGVSVHVFGDPNIGHGYCPTPSKADVIVGTVSLLLKLLHKRPLSLEFFKIVVLDEPDSVEAPYLLFHLRRLKGSFQIGVFSERKNLEFVEDFFVKDISEKKQDELVGIKKYVVTGVVNNKELPKAALNVGKDEAALDVGKKETSFLEESEFLDTPCKVYASFEDMICNKKLLGGIKACEYDKPSKAQQKALVPLGIGLDVIVRGESQASTICIGILQRLNCTSDKCQAIVVTADHDSAVRIRKDMLELGRFLDVKVHAIDGRGMCANPTGAHVVVGTPESVFYFLRTIDPCYVKIVVMDKPNDMMVEQISFILEEFCWRYPKKSVQICVFLELWPEGMCEFVVRWMINPEIITVKEPDKIIEEHQVISVGDVFTFDAMGLSRELLLDIKEYGYDKPSAAQQKALLPLPNDRDVIVQGESYPGKISTICLWILQRVNCNSGCCQALVFAAKLDSAKAIGRDMLQLGKSLGVKVHVVGNPSCSNHDLIGADVVVGAYGSFRHLIMTGKLSVNDIKMVALDEPDQLLLNAVEFAFFILPHYIEKASCKPFQTVAFSELRPRKMGKLFQIGVFSELWLREIGNWAKCFMMNPKIIALKERDALTFKGIEKHQVIEVVDDNSKTRMLLGLFQPGIEETSVVVFVDSDETVDILFKEMHDSIGQRWNVQHTNQILNHKVRSKISQALQSDSPCVLITTEGRFSGIDFQQVRLVVNYDMTGWDPRNYLGRMGWFREKVKAINFVPRDEWGFLFDIQTYYKEENMFFEAFPLKSTAAASSLVVETGNVMEVPKPANGIKHYMLHVYPKFDSKLGAILDTLAKPVSERKSIIFVNDSKDIIPLSENCKQGFPDIEVFTNGQMFSSHNRNCMLITSDVDDLHCGYPKEVPLVINFDLPLSTSSYNRRIACCGTNGVVVHFATVEDWLMVLHVQSQYKCRLRCPYEDLVERYTSPRLRRCVRL